MLPLRAHPSWRTTDDCLVIDELRMVQFALQGLQTVPPRDWWDGCTGGWRRPRVFDRVGANETTSPPTLVRCTVERTDNVKRDVFGGISGQSMHAISPGMSGWLIGSSRATQIRSSTTESHQVDVVSVLASSIGKMVPGRVAGPRDGASARSDGMSGVERNPMQQWSCPVVDSRDGI